jgi:serine/threonine protein kinase
MNVTKLAEEAIYHVARGIRALEARNAYLFDVCGDDTALLDRVDALLRVCEQEPSFLEVSPHDARAGAPGPIDRPGTSIGSYRLMEQIGEGGMGVVYVAEQQVPVRRKVALKLIKAGKDSRQVLARFGAERQALALMDHPNIAKVLEAGATEQGRPYFVMELVKGVPITRFCDQERLTPRERIELFIPVCQAAQHAHQKGIIHRDLKPSNVLVGLYDGKPVPKVIDFGVAKASGLKLTEATMFTVFGTVIGTPEYMSPEQAQLDNVDIDTRSDIYSLGVLLYELLTGTTPLDRKWLRQSTFLEVLRVIRDEEPPAPSSRLSKTAELPSIAAHRSVEPRRLMGLVQGELDWIVMKALEKDRARRYETADGLASDLRRYLDDEPVQACPPSAWYRFGKFSRRNKAALVAVGLIAMAVLVGIGMLALSNVLITREKNQTALALSQAKASESVAKAQGTLAQARYREVQESLARQTSETARQAFEKEQIGPGLLWTIESWRAAREAEQPALQRAARANLDAGNQRGTQAPRSGQGSGAGQASRRARAGQRHLLEHTGRGALPSGRRQGGLGGLVEVDRAPRRWRRLRLDLPGHGPLAARSSAASAHLV